MSNQGTAALGACGVARKVSDLKLTEFRRQLRRRKWLARSPLVRLPFSRFEPLAIENLPRAPQPIDAVATTLKVAPGTVRRWIDRGWIGRREGLRKSRAGFAIDLHAMRAIFNWPEMLCPTCRCRS